MLSSKPRTLAVMLGKLTIVWRPVTTRLYLTSDRRCLYPARVLLEASPAHFAGDIKVHSNKTVEQLKVDRLSRSRCQRPAAESCRLDSDPFALTTGKPMARPRRTAPVFQSIRKVYVDLYSAFLRKAPQMRSDMDHSFTCKLHHAYLYSQPQNITALWLVLILPSHGG